MNGIVFGIQRFCTHDGPGIRTTVFLKGCPLRCQWCHNPESWSAQTQKMAGEICGYEASVGQILAEVKKDEVFYRHSGGGLTLSGGEPLSQADFAYELLSGAKQEGIHTCIETSGFGKPEDVQKLAEVTDLFLYDWKLTNDPLHERYTGVGNRLISDNLAYLARLGAQMILRCPIIPGINDTEEHLCGIAGIANAFSNILAVEIEPYHPLGNGKYKKIGQSSHVHLFKMPTADQVDAWIQAIKRRTATDVHHA